MVSINCREFQNKFSCRMFAYKEAWKSICGSTKTSFTSSLFEGWTTTKKWSLWYIRYSLKGLNEFTTIPKAPQLRLVPRVGTNPKLSAIFVWWQWSRPQHHPKRIVKWSVTFRAYRPFVSLWQRAYARNVRLCFPYRNYTNLFIFWFVYIWTLPTQHTTFTSQHEVITYS